tara:strand:+ start:2471 stop:3073 length:603 start_codon:yes stop_codon:yes gene_type:complete
MLFLIRNMQTNETEGSPFYASKTGEWPNGASFEPVHEGAEYWEAGNPLYRVFRFDDMPATGAGSVVTYGDPVFDETRYTRTVSRSPTINDVREECIRRLSLGFDYDFGDSRGIHRIGTTERDMAGWQEVTTIAQALINASLPTQPISIATDTGACVVTPVEWQSILIASAQFRQPIWQASFVLQAMNPIPADYTSGDYWN